MRNQSKTILILSVIIFLLFIAGVPSSFKISLGTVLSLVLAVVAFFHYRAIHPVEQKKTSKHNTAPYMENTLSQSNDAPVMADVHDGNGQT